jgi:manganese catalase
MPIPKIETSFMPEVKEMEERNLHNHMWTYDSGGTSQIGSIFNGNSPFGDGELETIRGNPEGFGMPQLPEAPQVCAWYSRSKDQIARIIFLFLSSAQTNLIGE